MTSNYYYFVASLPDILLDGGKQTVSCTDFIHEAADLLTQDDFRLLNLLRLPFDNNNLLRILENRDIPFDKRGSIDQEELAAGLKMPDSLPAYMQQFLEEYRANKTSVAGLTPSDHLATLFYNDMIENESEFIGTWYSFDLHLRNLVAGINCRKGFPHLEARVTDHNKSISMIIIGNDEVAESLRKSNAPDFGLSNLLPWTDRVVALAHQGAPEFEKGLDILRWEMVNEMTTAAYFSAETVFGFFIKLIIVERWQILDPAEGRNCLNRFIEELKSSYTVPSIF